MVSYIITDMKLIYLPNLKNIMRIADDRLHSTSHNAVTGHGKSGCRVGVQTNQTMISCATPLPGLFDNNIQTRGTKFVSIYIFH